MYLQWFESVVRMRLNDVDRDKGRGQRVGKDYQIMRNSASIYVNRNKLLIYLAFIFLT